MSEVKEMAQVTLREASGGKVLEIELTGRLQKEDYGHFVPELERLVNEYGKIRVLVEMHDFHGWSAGALWEDIKFDLRHFRDIERLAIVGEKAWERGMAAFCRPFTTATVRYFEHSARDQARSWLAMA